MRQYMKCFRALLAVSLLFSSSLVWAEPGDSRSGAKLDGGWSYGIDYDKGQVTITGKAIVNAGTRATGKLKYALVLCPSPYDGGDLRGWPLCECELNPLEPNYQYDGINRVLPFKDQPATGNYSVVLALFEEKYGSYGLVQCAIFSKPLAFQNQLGRKIDGILGELKTAQRMCDYYFNLVTTSPDPNTVVANGSQANDWNSKVYGLKMELIGYGYYPDSANPSYGIPIEGFWTAYEKLTPPAPVSPAPLPSFSAPLPAASTPSAAAPASAPATEADRWETCPWCNGTGKCRFCYGTGWITGVGGLTRCDSCDGNHDGVCSRCHGKGKILK
jgi:hypothetical protein